MQEFISMIIFRNKNHKPLLVELASNVLHITLLALFGAFTVMITLRSMNII
jgi:hypothetical protein